jgi:serine/threonine protein kinase
MTELKLQQCRLDGRYDIQECLGRGSYAEIYVARDLAARQGDQNTVVIKALNVQLQGEPDAELEATLIANFQNEAIALDRVRHQNVISRLGHGTAIDLSNVTFHYIVLEYMPGGDMAARCRKQPYPLDRALYYLEQVCAGLAHAHANGVIHRDIKPQNLLLSGDTSIVKIADFGVAKLEATEGAITRVGTNIYAPPEHNPLMQTGPLDSDAVRTATQQLTPAADVYSLAKTTYSMLVGEPPRRFAHRPITEFPPAISNERWARRVLSVLERSTQNSPHDRYQTVSEFWDELRDAGLAPTMLLNTNTAAYSAANGDSILEQKETVPIAPPRPQFDSTRNVVQTNANGRRPRIVVPTSARSNALPNFDAGGLSKAGEIIASLPDELPANRERQRQQVVSKLAGFPLRFLIVIVMIASFAGMLWATHYYIKKRRATEVSASGSASAGPVVGDEAIASTDVNLRADPSLSAAVVGMAEKGSRVKILSIRNSSFEVLVLQHGRAKADAGSQDRGWIINKKYLDLNQ